MGVGRRGGEGVEIRMEIGERVKMKAVENL